MSRSILLPINGNHDTAPAIARCMRLARAQAASVIGLYLLPCEDLSTPEDDSYLPESERPASVVHAAEVLRTVQAAAATVGVPCMALTRCAASPYAAMVTAARERQCKLIYLDALGDRPTAADLALLRQAGLSIAHTALPA